MKVNKGIKSGEVTKKPVKDGRYKCCKCKKDFKSVKVINLKYYCEVCFNEKF